MSALAQPVAPARIAVVVLTLNEEKNLGACLDAVAGWAPEIVVVDSGSTDATQAIAREHGARVLTHPFETHARQWTWALRNAPITAEWVLGIDADQALMPELRGAIDRFLGSDEARSIDGVYVRRRQVFRGKWIRHGGYYPKYLLKLFRRSSVTIPGDELVDHHFAVAGRTASLEYDLVERNRNEDDLSVWLAKHLRYARLQAEEEERRLAEPVPDTGPDADRDARMRRTKALWIRSPLFLRSFAYFFYRYFLRLGFLDGREGFVFHFMQGLWYRLLVDIHRSDIRNGKSQ